MQKKKEVLKKSRRKYDQEFKDQLVRRLLEGQPGNEISEHFGVSSGLVYRWKADYLARLERGERAEHSPSIWEAENRQLKRQIKRIEEERDILKKALAIFGRGK